VLDALLEGLVEGAEIPLGLGDGLGRQVSQDGPDLLGGGRDVHGGRDGAHRIQLLTKRQLR